MGSSSVLNLIAVLQSNGESVALRELSLQNCRLGDKMAVVLIETLLARSKVVDLNLSQNGLGFKTGHYLLS